MQPQPPKKRGVGKCLLIGCSSLLVLLVLVIIIVVVAAGSGSGGNSSSSGSSVALVGQTITVSSVASTLLSVHPLPVGPDDLQPEVGNEYVVVRVKLVNNGASETTYNEYDFHAASGAGNVIGPEIPPSAYAANKLLNSGTLTAGGGTVTGDIIFQVPIGDHQAELTWQPSIFGNTTTYAWNLGL